MVVMAPAPLLYMTSPTWPALLFQKMTLVSVGLVSPLEPKLYMAPPAFPAWLPLKVTLVSVGLPVPETMASRQWARLPAAGTSVSVGLPPARLLARARKAGEGPRKGPALSLVLLALASE